MKADKIIVGIVSGIVLFAILSIVSIVMALIAYAFGIYALLVFVVFAMCIVFGLVFSGAIDPFEN